jgi:hypothetical protein
MKIEGSASGSISQRHGSADPDPHQNVMYPQHWGSGSVFGPPRSGSISQMYGSGSGSSLSSKTKIMLAKKKNFAPLESLKKGADPELDLDPDFLVRDADPDPHQNFTNLQQCLQFLHMIL